MGGVQRRVPGCARSWRRGETATATTSSSNCSRIVNEDDDDCSTIDCTAPLSSKTKFSGMRLMPFFSTPFACAQARSSFTEEERSAAFESLAKGADGRLATPLARAPTGSEVSCAWTRSISGRVTTMAERASASARAGVTAGATSTGAAGGGGNGGPAAAARALERAAWVSEAEVLAFLERGRAESRRGNPALERAAALRRVKVFEARIGGTLKEAVGKEVSLLGSAARALATLAGAPQKTCTSPPLLPALVHRQRRSSIYSASLSSSSVLVISTSFELKTSISFSFLCLLPFPSPQVSARVLLETAPASLSDQKHLSAVLYSAALAAALEAGTTIANLLDCDDAHEITVGGSGEIAVGREENGVKGGILL